jgi:hypothetical protein
MAKLPGIFYPFPVWQNHQPNLPRQETVPAKPGRIPGSQPIFQVSVESISAPLFLAISRARLAASLALAASTAFSIIFLDTAGFSSMNALSFSLTSDSTKPLTSLLPSFVLVCPSNWGDFILTLITAVNPSRTSSPLIFAERFLGRLPFTAY